MDSPILSDRDIQELADNLISASSEVIAKDLQVNLDTLKKKARSFLDNYEILDENEKLFSRKKLKSLINNPKNINYVKNMQGKNKTFYTRAKYILAFEFDRYLTKFLAKLPKSVLYVYESEDKISTYKMSLVELAKYATAEGKLRISHNQLIAEGRKALEDAESTDIPIEHINKIQAAYNGTNARLQRFYNAMGLSGSNARSGILMWKLEKKWTLARVSNKGDIKEAYAAALMTEHQSKTDRLCRCDTGQPAYYDHNLIATFFNPYIYDVTNKAAIVEEDIQTKLEQYAVKSEYAHLPSLNQYITTANKIVSPDFLFTTPKELEAEIGRLFPHDAHRNIVLGTVSHISEKSLNNLLSSKDIVDAVLTIHCDFNF